MSEPVLHDVSTHPCAQCGGPRTVDYREWVDPAAAYRVTCLGCGNVTSGSDLDEAVSAWDDANAMRDVTLDETRAITMMLLGSHITPHFLHVLHDAVAVFAASDAPQDDLAAFEAWCATLVQGGPPA